MISQALAAHKSCCTSSRARCTRNSQSPCADMAHDASGRWPKAAEPSGSKTQPPQPRSPGRLLRMSVESPGRRRSGSGRVSGFCEKLSPAGSQLPLGRFLLRGASVFLPLLGHLQNVEKWIFTLAGFTETLVRSGSMRGSLPSLGNLALCSQCLRARQF